MASILLSAVQSFCGMGGALAPLLGGAIAAVVPVSPLNLIALLGWYLGIRYSKSQRLQRFKGDWKTILKWAALFAFLTMYLVYAVTIFFACRAVR